MTDGHRLSKSMKKVQAERRRPIQDVLRALYYEQGMTLAEMEVELGVPAKTLHGWMVRLGINQRSMAERAAQELTA